jgi:hypothetical protein
VTRITGATQLVPDKRNRSIFQNAVFPSEYHVFPSEYQITGRDHRPKNIICNIPSLELQDGTIPLKTDGTVGFKKTESVCRAKHIQ